LKNNDFDYNSDTFDDHVNAIWRGWIRMGPLSG